MKHLNQILTPETINELKPDNHNKPLQAEIQSFVESNFNKLIAYQYIPDKYSDVKIEQLKGSRIFLDQIKKILEWDFKSPAVLSLLSNNNGIGKTHMAWCMIKKYLWQVANTPGKIKIENIEVCGYDKVANPIYKNLFFKEYQILNSIKNTYDGSGLNESQMKQVYINKPLLVIDDLFRTKTNDWSLSVMFEIIDSRNDWNRPTIITSNYGMKEIKELDSSIASRIINNMCFEFAGNLPDARSK